MEKEFLKGLVDIIILLIIKREDNYGYSIGNIIQDCSDDLILISDATIYISLKRLEGLNCIKSYYKTENLPVKRKYYSITDTGNSILNNKLDDFKIITNLITYLKEDYNA